MIRCGLDFFITVKKQLTLREIKCIINLKKLKSPGFFRLDD